MPNLWNDSDSYSSRYPELWHTFLSLRNDERGRDAIESVLKKFKWGKSSSYYKGFVQGIVDCLYWVNLNVIDVIPDGTRADACITFIKCRAGRLSDERQLQDETEDEKNFDALPSEEQYIMVRNCWEKTKNRINRNRDRRNMKVERVEPEVWWGIKDLRHKREFFQGYVKSSVVLLKRWKATDSFPECLREMTICVGLITEFLNQRKRPETWRAFVNFNQHDAAETQPRLPKSDAGEHLWNRPQKEVTDQPEQEAVGTVLIIVAVVIGFLILRALF